MKLQSNELATQAYQEVKSRILSKRLPPGHKIVQDKLAEELGISRTPLRSALQMLEAENMVESIPRNGVVVRKFTNREIVEIFDCRIALEETAIRLFTNSSSDDDIKELKKLFLSYQSSSPIDESKYQICDREFHDSIIRKSGNTYLYRLFRQGNLLAFMDIIGLVRPAMETLPEHLGIIQALESRDADLAVQRIHEHLDKSRRLIQTSQKEMIKGA